MSNKLIHFDKICRFCLKSRTKMENLFTDISLENLKNLAPVQVY